MRTLFVLVCFAVLAANVRAGERPVGIEEAKKSFERMCYHSVVKDYVVGVSVSALEAHRESGVELNHNEAWTDACLDVAISIRTPQAIADQLPVNFIGFRVFYKKIDWQPIPDDTDPPIAKLVREQVLEKNDNFSRYYSTHAPWFAYFVESRVETLEKANKSVPVALLPGEVWTDFCILAVLERPREDTETEAVTFPDVYDGVHVVYRVKDNGVNVYQVTLIPGMFFVGVLLCITSCCLLRCYRKKVIQQRASASLYYPVNATAAHAPENHAQYVDQSVPFGDQDVYMVDPEFAQMNAPGFIINPDGTVYPIPPWYGMMAHPAPSH